MASINTKYSVILHQILCLILCHKISIDLILVASNRSASVRVETSLSSSSYFNRELGNNSKNTGEVFFYKSWNIYISDERG